MVIVKWDASKLGNLDGTDKNSLKMQITKLTQEETENLSSPVSKKLES